MNVSEFAFAVFGVRFWFVNAVREHVRVRSVRVRSVLRRPIGPLFANTAVREQFVRVRSDSGPRKRLPRFAGLYLRNGPTRDEKTQNDLVGRHKDPKSPDLTSWRL